MSARLRHIVLATSDLAGDLALARRGLGLAPGIRDEEALEKFDLEHEVLLLGSSYLEILAPLGNRPDTPAARFIARNGPGGYMLDLQVPDLEAVLARVAALGLAPVMRDVYHGNPICQLHPRDFGTLLEVDQISGPADWHWDAEFPAAERLTERARPTAAVIAVPEPGAMAARWADVFDGQPDGDAVLLDGVTVTFTAAGDGHSGLRSVDLRVPSGCATGDLEISGVRLCRHG